MTTDLEAPLTAGSQPVDDAHYRTAWPFEEATEDDRLAHMAGAHHFLTDSVDLHAKLHRLGPGVVPHEHLTPTEALMLRHIGGDRG